jgi:hypothetical protein
MKTFIVDIFPKIQKNSQKLNNLTLLTDQHWINIDNIFSDRTVYIFRKNRDLLISDNKTIEKAKWDYKGHKYLLIETSRQSYLFRHGFIDENILALKINNNDEYAIFVNEKKYDREINSLEKVIDFLRRKYLDSTSDIYIENNSGQIIINKKKEVKRQSIGKDNQIFVVAITVILILVLLLMFVALYDS